MRGGVLLFTLNLVLLGTQATRTLAQAWVQPRGQYYAKLSTSYIFATEEFDFEGNKQEIFADRMAVTGAWFRDVSVTGYFEYGLTERFTAVASLPLKILTTRDTQIIGPGLPPVRVTRTLGGLGDLWTFVRTPLLRSPVAVASQVGVKIPLGYEEKPEEDGQALPPLGTANVDGEVSLYVGKSLHPFPGYVSAGIGYRVRGGSLHDEVVYSAEGGFTARSVFLKIRIDGVENTHDPPDLSSPTNNAIVGDQDWIKVNPAASYAFGERFSIGLEVFHVLAGKNTLAGTTYALNAVLAQ